ncbi:MAG: hypothetical protein M1457_06005 [bacterium]|nr:hypothetical protein [bacterium]
MDTKIALDRNGNIYLVGKPNTFDYLFRVMKLTHDGDIIWSHDYINIENRYGGYGFALDEAGNIYISGATDIDGWTSGGYDTTYGGSDSDGYVVKLSNDGTLLWSTYLGGDQLDGCGNIAVDSTGAVYAAGSTFSSNWVSGGYDTIRDGMQDGFLVKLSPNGEHLWSTYLGGDNGDSAGDIVIDSADRVYVFGFTVSPGWVAGGYDTTITRQDYYVAKFTPDGTPLWSTYLGRDAGYLDDFDLRGAVDGAGNVYVSAFTESDAWMPAGFPSSYQGGGDAFVAKIANDGSRLLWAACLGGGDAEHKLAMTLSAQNEIYVVGWTYSPGWTSGGYLTTMPRNPCGFLAKIIDKVGALTVNIMPSAAVAGGARWRRVGATEWHESGKVDEFFPTGERAIEFSDLTGWVKPASQTVSIAKDSTATLTAIYYLDIGALSVTIEPGEAAAGARWRRVGTTTWLGSGGTEAGVLSGDWFVEFNDVAGWDKPVARDCTIKFNQTTRLTVYYAPSALNAVDPRLWTLY